ncbi:hypothetical protein LXA43DRAFT_1101450 [Ganoderma leucocontextum]|nr:hypothetical protein LXA43DRAFT_1101450 [Ganoderma leucocontextum]
MSTAWRSRSRPDTTKLPALAETIENVGQGSMMAMQNSRMLGAQTNGDGTEHFAGWPQWMLNLIDHCDEGAIYLRPLWTLPVCHSWTRVSGVTIVGDAASQARARILLFWTGSNSSFAGRVAEKANGHLTVCVGPDAPQAMIKGFGELKVQGEWKG